MNTFKISVSLNVSVIKPLLVFSNTIKTIQESKFLLLTTIPLQNPHYYYYYLKNGVFADEISLVQDIFVCKDL